VNLEKEMDGLSMDKVSMSSLYSNFSNLSMFKNFNNFENMIQEGLNEDEDSNNYKSIEKLHKNNSI
jgi:hypothetical protein